MIQRRCHDVTARLSRLGRRAHQGRRKAAIPSRTLGGGKGALFVKALLTHAEYDRNKWKD